MPFCALCAVKIERGIRRLDTGFQAYVRIGGRLRAKRFPADTKLKDIRAWRELQRVAVHYQIPALLIPVERTFANDVTEYLALVKAMPTYSDRTYRMQQWVTQFGPRERNTIAALEIRAVLERWRTTGHANGGKLSPASLNQRRTALLHFFTMMNGADGQNPVRGVPPYRVDHRIWRLPTLKDAELAIAAVTHGKWPKKAGTKTQARLRVLLYTGWPSAILKQLRKEDIHWRDRAVTVHGRRKGKGTPPRTIPVSLLAIRALAAFNRVDAYGTFSGSALHSALHRGCDRAKVPHFRVYDLRHLFITAVVLASNDERGASELALHSDPRQTRPYSRQAASVRAKAALDAAFPVKP
jgi:integrase